MPLLAELGLEEAGSAASLCEPSPGCWLAGLRQRPRCAGARVWRHLPPLMPASYCAAASSKRAEARSQQGYSCILPFGRCSLVAAGPSLTNHWNRLLSPTQCPHRARTVPHAHECKNLKITSESGLGFEPMPHARSCLMLLGWFSESLAERQRDALDQHSFLQNRSADGYCPWKSGSACSCRTCMTPTTCAVW
jgi:hypothetical protein